MTRYVRLSKRWVRHGKNGARWSPQAGVMERDTSDYEARLALDHSLAVFAVEDPASEREAIGCVVEWLYRGRPSDLGVHEVTDAATRRSRR